MYDTQLCSHLNNTIAIPQQHLIPACFQQWQLVVLWHLHYILHLRQQVLTLSRLLAETLWQHHCEKLCILCSQCSSYDCCICTSGTRCVDVVALWASVYACAIDVLLVAMCTSHTSSYREHHGIRQDFNKLLMQKTHVSCSKKTNRFGTVLLNGDQFLVD